MLDPMSANAERDFFEPVMLRDLVGEGFELPSLPAVFMRVSAQLEDENCSVPQVARSIQNDPSITTRLLKLVNSSYYGLERQVFSVAQALDVLGREHCKHILLDSAVCGAFGDGEDPAFSMLAFWKHSIKTALIARQLASVCEFVDDPEIMFTAGLLHDIGKLLLIERFPKQMLAAEETMIRRRIDQLSAELAQTGLTHTAVGEALMEHWGLPEILIDCARCHHESVHDGPNRHATHLIYLANRLSEYQPPLDDDETFAILDDIENWDMNQIGIDQIVYACQRTDELVFEVMESLGMIGPDIEND
jgi:putative nucleotidyltransferase with HDIG domain